MESQKEKQHILLFFKKLSYKAKVLKSFAEINNFDGKWNSLCCCNDSPPQPSLFLEKIEVILENVLLNHNAKNIDSDDFLKDFLSARNKQRKSRIWILFVLFFTGNESFKNVFSRKFSLPQETSTLFNYQSQNLFLEVTTNAGKNTGKNQSIHKSTKGFYIKLKIFIVSNNLT